MSLCTAHILCVRGVLDDVWAPRVVEATRSELLKLHSSVEVTTQEVTFHDNLPADIVIVVSPPPWLSHGSGEGDLNLEAAHLVRVILDVFEEGVAAYEVNNGNGLRVAVYITAFTGGYSRHGFRIP